MVLRQLRDDDYYDDEVEDEDYDPNEDKYFGDREIEQFESGGDEDETDASTEILIMLFLLMLAITFGHFLKKSKHKYLQESGLTVIIGMGAGFLLKKMQVEDYMTNLS